MGKILITADQHLGVPERSRDILWSLRVIREYAHRNDIDRIFCLGDLFHDRTALEIDILCAAYDYFTESKRDYGQTWLAFPGNHDMFLKHSWAINSLRPFSDLLTIVDTVKIVQADNVRFWILPFIHLEAAYMRVLRKIEEQYAEGDVLLTHIGALGATKNVCFLLKDWSMVTFGQSKFDQVYTGHFHTYQQVGRNVWYPGSPIPFKFDEGDCQHGFLVYDLETRVHEFINIWEAGADYFPNEQPPPNYLTVPCDCVDDITVGLAKNNILRMAIRREYTQNEKADIATHLSSLGAAGVRWVDISDKTEPTVMVVSGHDRMNVFDEWLKLDAANLGNLNMPLLHNLNKCIVSKGDDLYDTTADDDD